MLSLRSAANTKALVRQLVSASPDIGASVNAYEGMLIALPSQYWPSAQDSSPRELAQRLLRLARRILPRQVATSKRGPKIGKPKGYVDGATARAYVSTARVLAEARGRRP